MTLAHWINRVFRLPPHRPAPPRVDFATRADWAGIGDRLEDLDAEILRALSGPSWAPHVAARGKIHTVEAHTSDGLNEWIEHNRR